MDSPALVLRVGFIKHFYYKGRCPGSRDETVVRIKNYSRV